LKDFLIALIDASVDSYAHNCDSPLVPCLSSPEAGHETTSVVTRNITIEHLHGHYL